jgi:hypothetical protein
MTVCLGLVCSKGKQILLAADTRSSYGTVTSNDQTAKLFDLPSHYCGAVAGTLSQCEDVISELHHRMTKLPESIPEIPGEQVRKCILESYEQIYMTLAEETLRNDPRITLEQYFHDKKLASLVRRSAREVLKSIEVDVDLIVAGFYRDQPVQLVTTGGTSLRIRTEITPGNAVIGTGAIAALNWLNYRKQSHALGLAHTLFHLTEAKQFAEVEHTVGPWRQMILLWSGGFKPLEGGDDLIQEWWKKYGLPLSDGLENEKCNQAVREVFGLSG